MKRWSIAFAILALLLVLEVLAQTVNWTPLPVANDPLVRMPGTQPGQATLEAPDRCFNCHANYNSQVEPGFNWRGSMMAQAARDFVFFACLTVAAQDSIYALGNPNAVDICERCHFPKGWLEGRSDPPNASAMTGADYDGVHCDFCHTQYNPFFESTHQGVREGNDWLNYWDETNKAKTTSQTKAASTYTEDSLQAQAIKLFNGGNFFVNKQPFSQNYLENGAGQFFVSSGSQKRASFADDTAKHQTFYSRFHKSKYFCSSCHDVSNPALANLGHTGAQPLPTETNSAYSYFHVERTFSEFMLSGYAQQGGMAGVGPFAPAVFETSYSNNYIAKCQDCHMRDVVGVGCDKSGTPIRPTDSKEHPNSGQPLHDLTGGNIFVPYVLASTITGSPNYNAANRSILWQGPSVLTVDFTQGLGMDAQALLAGVDRAKQQLDLAASIEGLTFDSATGTIRFRVQNQTGHKLISGFPEGRRMFVNIRAFSGGNLVYEVNPYDYTIGTLKGLPSGYSLSSPPLGQGETYVDELVYEMHPTSTITGEESTFHFALATGRHKDNRIPPKGFRIADAAARLCEPVWHGQPAPDYFTSAEYAGGYDEVSLAIPRTADAVQVSLYYQSTSREYIEFLRDEINGTRQTLPSSAYIAQTDPFFAKLKAWGNAIWQLWSNNKDVPGAAPYMMAQSSINIEGACNPPVPVLMHAEPGDGTVTLTWSDVHSSDPGVVGYNVYYDQAGKAQMVAQLGLTSTFTDLNLMVGQQHCYKVTSRYADCESDYSNIICATPAPIYTIGQARGLVDGEWQVDSVNMVNIASGDPLAPLGLTSRAIATDPTQTLSYIGLNTSAMLVRTWGKVTGADEGASVFYLDDGGDLRDGLTGHAGLKIQAPAGMDLPDVDANVTVTGISRVEVHTLAAYSYVNGQLYAPGTTVYVPVIWIRDADDVVAN